MLESLEHKKSFTMYSRIMVYAFFLILGCCTSYYFDWTLKSFGVSLVAAVSWFLTFFLIITFLGGGCVAFDPEPSEED